jgi:WD40 repeat protein
MRQLLAGAVAAADQEALVTHVETCPACQKLLARLSNDAAGIDWDLLRGGLPAGLSEADAPILRRFEETPPSGELATQSDLAAWPELISFPGPPTDKGPLGQLDGLHICRELGRGRYGVVFQAVDEMERLVAVKVLKPQLAGDPRERLRFEEEARKAAAVRHDHIVTMHRVGQAPGSGLPYLVMEYLEGETLASRLWRARVLPPRQAAEVVRQVALGLAAAHTRGLVHRDVKPSNILLEAHSPLAPAGESGRGEGVWAKITDFGLARATETGSAVSQSGAVVGTPTYISPEQVTAPAKVDGRSDVYALGVVLYEALTGERPFRGLPHLVLHQVVHDEPRPPRQLNDAVPRDLETITLKCLAKEPGRRYQSAGDLAEDLQRWLEGRPIQARPIGVLGRTWRWCRRKPGLAGALSAAAIFLVVGTVVSSLLAVLAREERRWSERRYYASEMKLACLDWEAGRTGMVQQRLREQGASDLRGFEWHYLQRLCQLELRVLQGHTDTVEWVVFSPDGKHLASSSRDRTVKLWDAATGKEILTLRGHTGVVNAVAFSPDGKHLASAGGGDKTVTLWDTTTGKGILKLQAHDGPVSGVAFSPDGKYLGSAGRAPHVILWDAITGDKIRTLQGHTDGDHRNLAFSPDGRRVASPGDDNIVRVWDAASGKEILKLQGHTDVVFSVAFSPDGRRIASGGWDGTARVWDAATGRETLVFKGHMGRVYGVAFSPHGRQIASASQDATVRVWDAATGQEALVLREHTHRVICVAFSPDGRRVASAGWDGTVRVWDAALRQPTLTLQGRAERYGLAFSYDGRRLASASQDGTVKVWDTTGREILTLGGHTGAARGVAFSPDDRQIVSASQDRTVRLWDAATGRPLRSLPGHMGSILGVAFSPDGRYLASVSPDGHDGTVRLWDATTGRPIYILRAYKGAARMGNYKPVFSPDSKHLAFPSEDNTVKVWDAATGQHILTCRGHLDRVVTVAFSPDGKQLASGGNDQMVKLWDARTGQPIRSFHTHSGTILSVAFSPDGQRLASTGGDATVRLWDTATGQEILTLHGHRRAVFSVAFSPDGQRLASASLDGTVKVWDATEVTPERRIEHEARGLVQWLFQESLFPALPNIGASTVGLLSSPLDPGPLLAASALIPGRTPLPVEVAAAVRRDPTITDAVRQQALAWVEQFWRIQVRAEAAHVVVPLRDPEEMLKTKVLDGKSP